MSILVKLQAASNSQDSYVQAFRDWFGSGSEGQCTSGVINSAAQAVATASAEVIAAATPMSHNYPCFLLTV